VKISETVGEHARGGICNNDEKFKAIKKMDLEYIES
jgi:hypothetical protein